MDKKKIGQAKVALSKWKSVQRKDPFSPLYSDDNEEPWAKDFQFDDTKYVMSVLVNLDFSDKYETVFLDFSNEEKYILIHKDKKIPIRAKNFSRALDKMFEHLQDVREQYMKELVTPTPLTGKRNIWDEMEDDKNDDTTTVEVNDEHRIKSFMNEFKMAIGMVSDEDRKILRLEKVDIDEYILHFTLPGASEDKRLPFEIKVPPLYFSGEFVKASDFKFTSSAKELKLFVNSLSKFVKEIPQGVTNVTDIVVKALQIYIECADKVAKDANSGGYIAPWYERVDEESRKIETYYERIWGKSGETEKLLPHVGTTYRRILYQLSIIKDIDATKAGYSVKALGDNVFMWIVELFGFGKETQLAKDLHEHAKKFQTMSTRIILDVKFNAHFPTKPPYIRLVRPRLLPQTGGISFYGTFENLDILNKWSSKITMDQVFRAIQEYLVTNNARIDMRINTSYDKVHAQKYFERRARLETMKIQSAFNREITLPAYSSYGLRYYNSRYTMVRTDLEDGNRIMIPSSKKSLFSTVPRPLILELKSTKSEPFYCGVVRDPCPEGVIVLPSWLMQEYNISEGQNVHIRAVKIPTGTLVTFQPHSKEFYEFEDAKIAIQNKLQGYATLQEGTTIHVREGSKVQKLEVLSTKPAPVICIDAGYGKFLDLNCDFAPALDYEEEESVVSTPIKEKPKPKKKSKEDEVNPIFLKELLEMGFPKVRVVKALLVPTNNSVQDAIDWILKHQNDEDIDTPYDEEEPEVKEEPKEKPKEQSPGFVIGGKNKTPVNEKKEEKKQDEKKPEKKERTLGGNEAKPKIKIPIKIVDANVQIPLDKDQPITKIQVQLPNGEKLAGTFNTTQTVAILRAWIECSCGIGSKSYELWNTYPRKQLTDVNQKLEDYKNSSLLLRRK